MVHLIFIYLFICLKKEITLGLHAVHCLSTHLNMSQAGGGTRVVHSEERSV